MVRFCPSCVHLLYFLRKYTEFHVKRTECQIILLHFLLPIFLIIPAITALPPPLQPNALAPTIDPLALLFYHVEALIKEARSQAKILREDNEREVIATDAVAMRSFRDAEKSLLVGGAAIATRLDLSDPGQYLNT